MIRIKPKIYKHHVISNVFQRSAITNQSDLNRRRAKIDEQSCIGPENSCEFRTEFWRWFQFLTFFFFGNRLWQTLAILYTIDGSKETTLLPWKVTFEKHAIKSLFAADSPPPQPPPNPTLPTAVTSRFFRVVLVASSTYLRRDPCGPQNRRNENNNGSKRIYEIMTFEKRERARFFEIKKKIILDIC